MKNLNEINKEISKAKTQSEILFISQENPTYFFNAKYSYDGSKLIKCNVYDNLAKANYYARKGNIHTYNNGNLI
jgi:hypothetical protein